MAERTHSEGWITFAAILAGIAGGVNSIFGIAAMFGLGRFSDPALMFASLYAFGLMLLSAGIVQLVTALLLVRRNALGRIAGIIVASVSILMWSLWLGAYTTSALIALVLDVLVIYGLSVTGEHFTSA
jgi:uncharacterized membrane protein